MKLSKKTSVVGGGVLVLALIAFGYGRAVNTLPELKIPSPKMPRPNAFDDFVKAGKAVKDFEEIGEAFSMRPADGAKIYSRSEKEALVSQNREAVRLLRKGFAHPYLNPPARSFTTLFPYYTQFRGFGTPTESEGTDRGGAGGLRLRYRELA